jgi:hypothetical protein
VSSELCCRRGVKEEKGCGEGEEGSAGARKAAAGKHWQGSDKEVAEGDDNDNNVEEEEEEEEEWDDIPWDELACDNDVGPSPQPSASTAGTLHPYACLDAAGRPARGGDGGGPRDPVGPSYGGVSVNRRSFRLFMLGDFSANGVLSVAKPPELSRFKCANDHLTTSISLTHFKRNNSLVCRVSARYNHGSTGSKQVYLARRRVYNHIIGHQTFNLQSSMHYYKPGSNVSKLI